MTMQINDLVVLVIVAFPLQMRTHPDGCYLLIENNTDWQEISSSLQHGNNTS